ncbi:hypothetical protein GCM10027070_19010 [Barrientosiimonas humi]
MTSRQLNIRLSPQARDRLDALAFVRRTAASTLARDIVLDYLHHHGDEPGHDAALRALDAHDNADRTRPSARRLDVAWIPGPWAEAASSEDEHAEGPREEPLADGRDG